MKRSLGITPENDKEFDKFWADHEGEVCLGQDVETLPSLIKEKFLLSFLANYSLLADFVDRFEANQSIWTVIDKIRKRSRIGLLTNMYPGMFSAIQERGIMPKVSREVVIDSNVVCLYFKRTEVV